jgi:3',5'-cyclic AMP phosphodiesterase CpdA
VARVIVVSDSHLSERAAGADQNWSAVLRHIESARPDLVVHLGDLSLDGANAQADLGFARSRLDRLTVPLLAVPGNHDLGDNRGYGSGHSEIDADRRQRWLSFIGPDQWTARLDGWQLIGINAQLFGSELTAENDQWVMLEAALRDADAAERLALVLHKPVSAPADEMAAAPVYRFVPQAARSRLAELCGARKFDLVLSGHVHQYRQIERDGATHLWAPATWAVLPESVQPVIGRKRCGLLELELTAGEAPRHAFIEPEGLRQLTITVDIPDPYSAA